MKSDPGGSEFLRTNCAAGSSCPAPARHLSLFLARRQGTSTMPNCFAGWGCDALSIKSLVIQYCNSTQIVRGSSLPRVKTESLTWRACSYKTCPRCGGLAHPASPFQKQLVESALGFPTPGWVFHFTGTVKCFMLAFVHFFSQPSFAPTPHLLAAARLPGLGHFFCDASLLRIW